MRPHYLSHLWWRNSYFQDRLGWERLWCGLGMPLLIGRVDIVSFFIHLSWEFVYAVLYFHSAHPRAELAPTLQLSLLFLQMKKKLWTLLWRIWQRWASVGGCWTTTGIKTVSTPTNRYGIASSLHPKLQQTTEVGVVLAMLAEQSLNVRTEVNKCSAHQKYHNFIKLWGLWPLFDDLLKGSYRYLCITEEQRRVMPQIIHRYNNWAWNWI